MTEFEKTCKIILSLHVVTLKQDRQCSISSEQYFAGDKMLRIGYVDRAECIVSTLYLNPELEYYFESGHENTPLHFREWLYDNKFIEDTY